MSYLLENSLNMQHNCALSFRRYHSIYNGALRNFVSRLSREATVHPGLSTSTAGPSPPAIYSFVFRSVCCFLMRAGENVPVLELIDVFRAWKFFFFFKENFLIEDSAKIRKTGPSHLYFIQTVPCHIKWATEDTDLSQASLRSEINQKH